MILRSSLPFAAALSLVALFIYPNSEPELSAVTSLVEAPAEDREQGLGDRFAIDAGQSGHSSIHFRVMHAQVSWFRGRFNSFEGDFRLDRENLKESFVNVSVEAASVDGNSEGRNRHLRNQDFFSVKEFPKIGFKSSKVEAVGEKDFKVTGELSLRGKTQEVSFVAEFVGAGKANERFGYRCGYEASFSIMRKDFGMTYGGSMLSNEVTLEMSIQGREPR